MDALQDFFMMLEENLALLLKDTDWRNNLEKIILNLRQILIFDHIVLFAPPENNLEILFARAVGRGRAAEEDVDWGSGFVQRVFAEGRALVSYPDTRELSLERIRQPFFFGLPVKDGSTLLGGLVFVRFGGPSYTDEDQRKGRILASFLALLLSRQRAARVQARLEHLQNQLRLQEDFVSTISHDLRTPLGFIKGYVTTLLREDTHWDQTTRREFLQIIDEEADRLAELIEEVLESARLQSDTVKMHFQKIRLESLIRDTAVRALARHKTLQVDLDLPENAPSVYADATRLSQVLENLFNNAVKYAPQSPIHIRLQFDKKWAYIAFSDEGPGIAPESLPFIFDKFYRAQTDARFKGTGLGLYICREIIRAHHGEIWVESEPGNGTSFFIKLPLRPDPDTEHRSE